MYIGNQKNITKLLSRLVCDLLCIVVRPLTQPQLSQIHERSALRLREMCSRNGGLFIKVGQHIGALEYLLPKEYVRTFQLFHSEAPQTPLPRLISVVEEELGVPCTCMWTFFCHAD